MDIAEQVGRVADVLGGEFPDDVGDGGTAGGEFPNSLVIGAPVLKSGSEVAALVVIPTTCLVSIRFFRPPDRRCRPERSSSHRATSALASCLNGSVVLGGAHIVNVRPFPVSPGRRLWRGGSRSGQAGIGVDRAEMSRRSV
jgi:hypothetical protein